MMERATNAKQQTYLLHILLPFLCLQRSTDTVQSSPMVVLMPLGMFVILAGIGSWAVMWSATLQETATLSQARAIANSTALALELTLFVNIQPVVVLSLFVWQNPQWDVIQARFARIATSIVAEAAGEVGNVFESACPRLPSFLLHTIVLDYRRKKSKC